MNNILARLGLNNEIKGTEDTDVLSIISGRGYDSVRVVDLSEINVQRINDTTFSITTPLLSGATVRLNNFNANVDIIRTSDGDFTLQEILDHGNNAPFYKQAQINMEINR